MTINEYFDKVVVINLARREDRWKHVLSECDKHHLEVERFEAIDLKDYGNHGCVASHRAVLEKIIKEGLQRTLILEDDFEFCHDATFHFDRIIKQVPEDWDMLYLGGHYGDYENKKISDNVVQFSYMKTTSSFGITRNMAHRAYPHILGGGPIDELYGALHPKNKCYIFCPRICVQYTNYSDLSQKDTCNMDCMMNRLHERYLGMECIE